MHTSSLPPVRRFRAHALTLALLATVIAVGAPWDSALSATELSLAEAVDRAITTSPRQSQAGAQSQGRFGLWQEQLGRFDWTLGADARFRRDRSELTRGQIQFEQDRRQAERILIAEFTRIADDLADQLAESTGRPLPDCRTFLLVVDGELVCVDTLSRSNRQRLDEVLQTLVATASDPSRRAALEAIQNRLLDLTREQAANLVILLRRRADEARIRLERLGVVPEVEERYRFSFGLGLSRLFPNGLGVSAGMTIDGAEDTFDGKPLRAGFGGKGLPRTYQSFLGMGLEIPLGRGRGRSSVAASARAAELGYQASQSTYQHEVHEIALDATLAYWRLAAAQERLRLLARAEGNGKSLSDDIGELARAGEIPAFERVRADARVATVKRERARAERDLQEAQARLADALGFPLTRPEEGLRASDPFLAPMRPEDLPHLRPEVLTDAALTRRADLEATRQLAHAAVVLAEGARSDQRRELNLVISAGYAGLYESFDDQLFAPSAYWEALGGHQTGPSLTVSLRTRAPFANRQARGQFLQASALATRSAIHRSEREREIDLEVIDAWAALRAAAAEVAWRSTARDRTAEVFLASRELLRAGEGSTIDLLLSDEASLQAELAELAARERWAASLASLRFAVGLPPAGPIPSSEELQNF